MGDDEVEAIEEEKKESDGGIEPQLTKGRHTNLSIPLSPILSLLAFAQTGPAPSSILPSLLHVVPPILIGGLQLTFSLRLTRLLEKRWPLYFFALANDPCTNQE